ncbi:hypothetical protein [Moraxella oculi]|uniref:Uncharacterized protein n=1 Tax=Moraxella oculi TaxID=2940516 RepID=A0ABW8U501_9GAMM
MKILKLLFLTTLLMLPTWAMADSWFYDIQEDEFVNGYSRIAIVPDSNNIVFLGVGFVSRFNNKPMVGFHYSESQNYIPSFCHDDCSIYLNVDGKKFPVFKAVRNSESYYLKDSNKALKAIKDAKVIKVELPPPLWGDVNVHTFYLDEPLDMEKLAEPK